MDRKAVATQTMAIMEQGYYETAGVRVEIGKRQEYSKANSLLLTPSQAGALLEGYEKDSACPGTAVSDAVQETTYAVCNCGTVDAILELVSQGKQAAVLNFASAKNPGGGFLNGAMAQEESLAASGCLYETQIIHEDYYKNNRACGTMMYTDHAIYSPDVVFFRDGKFSLLREPVTASVLTLPAVNMGQVMLKGEDRTEAERVMKRRMGIALAIFAQQRCRHLILGAYGCGVFRNDPVLIAKWWEEWLSGAFSGMFESIVFAVLDRSGGGSCINAFEHRFGRTATE